MAPIENECIPAFPGFGIQLQSPDDDDSVTEPESEEEQPVVPPQPRVTGKDILPKEFPPLMTDCKGKVAPAVDDDSVTESGSDDDLDENSVVSVYCDSHCPITNANFL